MVIILTSSWYQLDVCLVPVAKHLHILPVPIELADI